MRRCYSCMYNESSVTRADKCYKKCKNENEYIPLSNYGLIQKMSEEELAIFLHGQDFSNKEPRDIYDWLYDVTEYSEHDVKDYSFWLKYLK